MHNVGTGSEASLMHNVTISLLQNLILLSCQWPIPVVLAIRMTVEPVTPLISMTVVRISGIIGVRIASADRFILFLFSCYSHQSISDYFWEVYIVHYGVFAG